MYRMRYQLYKLITFETRCRTSLAADRTSETHLGHSWLQSFKASARKYKLASPVPDCAGDNHAVARSITHAALQAHAVCIECITVKEDAHFQIEFLNASDHAFFGMASLPRNQLKR